MRRGVIVDTGPLIALLNSRDPHHPWVIERWGEIESPLLTCEAVVDEACFLARQLGRDGPGRVLELVRREVLDPSFSLAAEIDAVARLADKYREVPMSLADACLVRMSELHRNSPVFTLDSRFKVYRRARRQLIPLLFPG